MEFIKKLYLFASRLTLYCISIFILHSCQDAKEISCKEINEKISSFYYQYQIELENSELFLDSTLFYINIGIENCKELKTKFLMNKLSILSIKQNYSEAINLIETFNKLLIPKLPYYKPLLLNRFKMMYAIKNNNTKEKKKYLKRCNILLSNFIEENRKDVDILLQQPKVELILDNLLGTAITQYYYYKSLKNSEGVKKELKILSKTENVNTEFIDLLYIVIQTDIMDFNGI